MTGQYGLRYPWFVVQVIPDFPRIRVRFADGTTAVKDLAGLIRRGGPFAPLADRAFFDEVGVVDGAVTWPNELDLAPDAMYDAAKG